MADDSSRSGGVVMDVMTSMHAIGAEAVNWSDPRWFAAGISMRRLDYWTNVGYLRVLDDVHPGSGYTRLWPVEEVAIAARMVRLIDAGLTPAAAATAARASGPVEIGPGVWVGVADLEEAAPVACELCHEHPPVGVRDGLRLCVDCARHVDYYASLTPDEWRAEQKAMDAYVAETRGQ